MMMSFLKHQYDHGFKMFGGKDYDLVVVVLSLVVVCLSAKEVCLLVCGAGFVMKGEVVFH